MHTKYRVIHGIFFSILLIFLADIRNSMVWLRIEMCSGSLVNKLKDFRLSQNAGKFLSVRGTASQEDSVAWR
jgi:hypothetical protein